MKFKVGDVLALKTAVYKNRVNYTGTITGIPDPRYYRILWSDFSPEEQSYEKEFIERDYITLETEVDKLIKDWMK